MPNKYLPIGLSLEQRKVLVVGGGKVALRKVEVLLKYDSDITVVAPEVARELEFLAEHKKIKLETRLYKSPEAATYGLVIGASDNLDVNVQVYDDCQSAGVPVNIVDNPPLCDVIFPAVLNRDVMTVAISTDGKAPFLSGHLRLVLENIFPKHWNKLVNLAVVYRQEVHRQWADDPQQKHRAFERFVEIDWKSLFDKKDDAVVQATLQEILMGEPEGKPTGEAGVDESPEE